ncbi:F-type H+-transporting ATPase subunit b [Malonomonas rubra DSM 5091]|uniref:ATP synthase subunit b n=1 Tax=Malonomonas rubra DSM 5091 TaxID=1122189 RepID=A0A1M6JV89_MALRU|nr:ATP synthase F0 subunit B [Malonomonas rubra]SHJ50635.1 F-type H+-transporting ATPase subunit b [Malonomonas rubra DSM 5091]
MYKKTRTVLLTSLLLVSMTGVALAAGGGHADSGVLLKDFLWRILNFGCVVAILVYFLRKPLKKGLAGRTEEIEKALAEAKKAKEEAEAKFAEYDRKLDQATEEIAEISDAIRREGELEKQRIIANAKEMAVKIEQDAEKAAELEVAKARRELQQEATALAVELAEGLLKKNFTKDDDARLIDEYMQKVGELH